MEKSTTLKRRYSKGAIKLPVRYSGVSMDELKDDLFGEEGTSERDLYEAELKEEILGDVIRHMRKLKHLTQEELGSKVGVGKAQISKIEKNYNNVTIANFLRILHALNVKVRLSVEVEAQEKKEIELSI